MLTLSNTLYYHLFLYDIEYFFFEMDAIIQ